MPQMHSFQLSDDLSARLATLSRSTKRTKSFFIREALERAIEDLEDAYLAENAYEEFIKSGAPSKSLEEVENALGLAD